MPPRGHPRLATYRAKRDPAATPEPFEAGAASAGALRYSMQKHDATRLHWDLRLEWDGVLLSWAVTRGPSLDPADKRLAVRTEDHPISYLTFEGTIPKGQYGGGTVMLWDLGHWRPVADADAGLAKGHLRFQLYGRRMTGLWDLVRVKPRPGERAESWLMVKADDAAAGRPDPVARYVTSVGSGREMAAIAAAAPAAGPRGGLLAMPKPAGPMLPRLVTDAPAGGDWLHEIKIDGYRGMVRLGQGGPRILTRNGLDWTDRFAPLVPALAELPARSGLIDGEIVAGAGRHGFSALQQAIGAGGPFAYVAFDLLALDGASLTGRPLTERRAALERLLQDVPPMGMIDLSTAVPGDGAGALAAICAAGGEGIVSKRAGSTYRAGRADSWRKTKCVAREAFAVIGWLPSDSPGRPFSSLLLASREDGGWRYRGKVGTGFDAAAQDDLAARMAALARKTAPAEVPRSESRGARWVGPQLMAEVRHAGLTGDGLLRHASFQGLREDKMPPEPPEGRSPAARVTAARAAPGLKVAGVNVTSPGRVVFPDAAVSKGEVAEYYAAVAPRMLPFAADRPLSLVRLPEGVGGESFFQKHAGKGFPAQVRLAPMPGEDEPAMYVADAAGLVAAAQMGTIEFHIRGTRRDRPDRPDRLVLDLDPDESLGFAEVRRAAVELRERLAALDLPSWPMVTGGKGIHVVCDLRRTVGWETVTLFSRTLATMLAAEEPDRFVAVMSKARRQGRIFIDWLRNEPQATAICPFSLRARPGARVAVPVSWQVLDDLPSADAFDIRSALEQADRVAPDRGRPATLDRAVRALVGQGDGKRRRAKS